MKEKKKAFVFDLDGTLFLTTAKEREANHKDGAFVEFADATMLREKSKPLPLLVLAKQVKAEGHSVYILTARNSIIAKAIHSLLETHGVVADYVHCVGDNGLNIPKYKSEILERLHTMYDNTYFYDNEEVNLSMAPNGVRTFKV
tara:strand:+ start:555 stop:986 length:432 start_codon:yes stop_codon:yes gene_type:complete